uniref:Uncharacterized protein n=1 Tax=Siphoviridae sp. ctJ0s2 TaxID=2827834 RepID=A0A8S5TFL7_9CAUD|nr:MAG TPA: hypothetical protein [Siphoviridae sp. ctJ0s2]
MEGGVKKSPHPFINRILPHIYKLRQGVWMGAL